MLLFYCPCLCLVHFCDSKLRVEENLCRIFLVCLYQYYQRRSNFFLSKRVGIPLPGLTLPHFCVCPKLICSCWFSSYWLNHSPSQFNFLFITCQLYNRIYNYLCNQCISPLTLWVRIPLMASGTRYNIMWSSLSVTCDGFLRVLSSTNKTDHYDITEILLKVALNTITLTPTLKETIDQLISSISKIYLEIWQSVQRCYDSLLASILDLSSKYRKII